MEKKLIEKIEELEENQDYLEKRGFDLPVRFDYDSIFLNGDNKGGIDFEDKTSTGRINFKEDEYEIDIVSIDIF